MLYGKVSHLLVPLVVILLVVDSRALLAAGSGETTHTNPKGQDASQILRARLDATGSIRLPCGTFEIGSTIELKSGTRVQGSGSCTVLKMLRSMPPAALHAKFVPKASKTLRAIFTNRAPGDSNIVIENLTLDGAASPGNAHLISFYRASNVRVEGVNFIGSGNDAVQDGISMIASTDYVVRGNTCTRIRNACYDQWDGSKRFDIIDNIVDGGYLLTYGILVNGISTAYAKATTSNFRVSGNRILAVRHLGIGAFGLCSPDRSTCGMVTDGIIDRNLIDGVSDYYGIWIGNAKHVKVAENKIKASNKEAIRVASQNAGGYTRNILVRDNVVCGSSEGPGINVGTGADFAVDVRVERNLVRGYSRAVKVAPNAHSIWVSP